MVGWRTAIAVAAALAAVLVLGAAGAGTARADTFTVDGNGDAPDALIDGSCDDGGGTCTLRAAVEESNASVAVDDRIEFDSAVFDAAPGTSAIVLATALPVLSDTVEMDGGNCAPMPCVELRGGAFDGLALTEGSAGSEVKGVGLTSFANGIVVSGPPDTAVPTLIGGDLPGEANVITGSGGAAILVNRVDGVEIRANRGQANGTFLDLALPIGPGNFTTVGAAEGLQAPVHGEPSPTSLTGTGEPNAVVRVFAKSSAASGEVGGLLATTTSNAAGAWTATIPGGVAEGQRLAATQTVPGPLASFQTSELSAGAQRGTAGPDTVITQAPPNRVRAKKRTVRVSFSFSATSHVASSPEVRFECSLDGGPFLPCVSPESAKVSKGEHSFQVRARDSLGKAGDPAMDTFKVLRKKKRKKKD